MTLLKCLAVGLVGLVLLSGEPASAQSGTAKYTAQALTNLTGLVEKAEKEGFKSLPGLSIFGGWLGKGVGEGSRWVQMLSFDLDPNREYRIIGSGDNDCEDLDLRIVDSEGKVVKTDDSTARGSEISFRPDRLHRYSVQMRLYKSRDNCVCVGLVLAK